MNGPALWSEFLGSCVFGQRSALLAKVCDDPSAGLRDCRILGDERAFVVFGLTYRNASTNDVSSLGEAATTSSRCLSSLPSSPWAKSLPHVQGHQHHRRVGARVCTDCWRDYQTTNGCVTAHCSGTNVAQILMRRGLVESRQITKPCLFWIIWRARRDSNS